MLALREDFELLSTASQASAMTATLVSVTKFLMKKLINTDCYTYNSLSGCFFQRAKSQPSHNENPLGYERWKISRSLQLVCPDLFTGIAENIGCWRRLRGSCVRLIQHGRTVYVIEGASSLTETERLLTLDYWPIRKQHGNLITKSRGDEVWNWCPLLKAPIEAKHPIGTNLRQKNTHFTK